MGHHRRQAAFVRLRRAGLHGDDGRRLERQRQADERQKLAEAHLLADMAKRLQHKLDGSTVVRNARVFDSDKATVGAVRWYVLRGRITAVLPASSPVRGGPSTRSTPPGASALPGLFDMHGHVGRWEGRLNRPPA